MGDYGSFYFSKEKTIIFQQDGQIYMYTYTHQDHQTQLRRLLIHLTQLFKKTFAHKIFNQIMIKLRRDKYDLGYELVYPSTEQHLWSMYFALDIVLGFWGVVSHQQGSQHFLRSWYLKDKRSSFGRSWGKSFPIGWKTKIDRQELGIHKEQRED